MPAMMADLSANVSVYSFDVVERDEHKNTSTYFIIYTISLLYNNMVVT